MTGKMQTQNDASHTTNYRERNVSMPINLIVVCAPLRWRTLAARSDQVFIGRGCGSSCLRCACITYLRYLRVYCKLYFDTGRRTTCSRWISSLLIKLLMVFRLELFSGSSPCVNICTSPCVNICPSERAGA